MAAVDTADDAERFVIDAVVARKAGLSETGAYEFMQRYNEHELRFFEPPAVMERGEDVGTPASAFNPTTAYRIDASVLVAFVEGLEEGYHENRIGIAWPIVKDVVDALFRAGASTGVRGGELGMPIGDYLAIHTDTMWSDELTELIVEWDKRLAEGSGQMTKFGGKRGASARMPARAAGRSSIVRSAGRVTASANGDGRVSRGKQEADDDADSAAGTRDDRGSASGSASGRGSGSGSGSGGSDAAASAPQDPNVFKPGPDLREALIYELTETCTFSDDAGEAACSLGNAIVADLTGGSVIRPTLLEYLRKASRQSQFVAYELMIELIGGALNTAAMMRTAGASVWNYEEEKADGIADEYKMVGSGDIASGDFIFDSGRIQLQTSLQVATEASALRLLRQGADPMMLSLTIDFWANDRGATRWDVDIDSFFEERMTGQKYLGISLDEFFAAPWYADGKADPMIRDRYIGVFQNFVRLYSTYAGARGQQARAARREGVQYLRARIRELEQTKQTEAVLPFVYEQVRDPRDAPDVARGLGSLPPEIVREILRAWRRSASGRLGARRASAAKVLQHTKGDVQAAARLLSNLHI